ncbi:hypothetical protein KUCAC02_023788, partial [Chaenocephalus aceratus]
MGLLQLTQKKADDRRMGIWGLPDVILSQTDTDIRRSIAIHGMNGPVVAGHSAAVQPGLFNQLNDRRADGRRANRRHSAPTAVMMPIQPRLQQPLDAGREKSGRVKFESPPSDTSGELCTLRLVEISVQTEGKLGTSMTQHGGMHQRMWLSASLSPSQSTPRAKSLFMGMSVCHRALANNPQDADSVHNPKESQALLVCGNASRGNENTGKSRSSFWRETRGKETGPAA